MTRFVTFLILIAIGGVSLSMSTPASATTYRWIDSNGIVNYSERKPRGIAAELVTVLDGPKRVRGRANNQTASTTPVAPSTSANTQANLSDVQQNMLQDLQAAEIERQGQIAAIRQDNCARSRRVLNNLSNLGRIRVTAADGSQSVLEEDQRNAKIAEAQQGIVENCDS
ncbi:MAG: DUF4124 domain-containing protein [Gammaproteobacteria bacterium]|nr:DUF4124 domain-containing protein [Gammaproteobacteria bacterium]